MRSDSEMPPSLRGARNRTRRSTLRAVCRSTGGYAPRATAKSRIVRRLVRLEIDGFVGQHEGRWHATEEGWRAHAIMTDLLGRVRSAATQ